MDEMDVQEIVERRRNRNRNVEYRDELGGIIKADSSEDADFFAEKPKVSNQTGLKRCK